VIACQRHAHHDLLAKGEGDVPAHLAVAPCHARAGVQLVQDFLLALPGLRMTGQPFVIGRDSPWIRKRLLGSEQLFSAPDIVESRPEAL
jgi:hypothetical protein